MREIWRRPIGALVNSVAMAPQGHLVVAGSYYYPYPLKVGTPVPFTDGRYGTYAFDGQGTLLWKNEFDGNEGVYVVTVSLDGSVVATGGLRSGGNKAKDPSVPTRGLVQAFRADGRNLLDYNDAAIAARVGSVSLSADGSVLAGVTLDGRLFVFSDVTGACKGPQIVVNSGPRLYMVSMHPSGEWLVACGKEGTVYYVHLTAGVVDRVVRWADPSASLPFLSCAVAASGGLFVVGGKNHVYLFSEASMTATTPTHLALAATPDGNTKEDVRWVAVSADGAVVSAVQNDGNDKQGWLLLYSTSGDTLTAMQPPIRVPRNPNGTSLTAAGHRVAVADGHPVDTPGGFYVFDVQSGAAIMQHDVARMNWPMMISPDGTVAVGGSDDGNVYYFA